MVLWRKESTRDNACFVDLFPSCFSVQNTIAVFPAIPQKDDELSTRLRVSGNEKFKAKSWRQATELYNKSLRFATEGSENISLAYANRSACFLNMKMFDKCLADIELAKKAGYPQRLLPKLNQRGANCLKLMEESNHVETKVEPVLSFDPDEKFPCMANVLEIRSNVKFGKHIVAKSDIDVGQIVLVEKAFAFDAVGCDQTRCRTCLKVSNLIPCSNCTDAMFCEVDCVETNEFHRIACGTCYQSIPKVKKIVESISYAINAFSTIDKLMSFVGEVLLSRDFESLPGDLTAVQMKYGMFLKLCTIQKDIGPKCIFGIYHMVLNIPEISGRFDSKQKKRFLMHLILQHILIIMTNAYAFGTIGDSVVGFIGIVSSLFNHACYNNTALVLCGNRAVGYVCRPVKEGEQMFVNYHTHPEVTTEQRQTYLRKDYRFECKCSWCVPCFKWSDCVRMQLDPDYRFGYQVDKSHFSDFKKLTILKSKLRKFLSKYGRLPWSDEIQTVLVGFDACMQKELEFSLY